MLAPIEAPRHFVEIAAQVLRTDIVVNANNLPLQERPNALDAVGVDAKIANVFPGRVIDRVVVVAAGKPDERGVLVGHNG